MKSQYGKGPNPWDLEDQISTWKRFMGNHDFNIPITVTEQEQQALSYISDMGMNPPDRLITDGRIHRYSNDRAKRNSNAWYVAYVNNYTNGSFLVVVANDFAHPIEGNIVFKGCGDNGSLTPRELRALSKKIEQARNFASKEKAKDQEEKGRLARKIFAELPQAEISLSPYALRKGLRKVSGCAIDGDIMVMPLYNKQGHIMSLQYIYPDGRKKLLEGARKKGCFGYVQGSGKPYYVCEGFATASSVNEATGHPVVIAVDCGNLRDATESAMAFFNLKPSDIVIVADNDSSGVGQRRAQEACEALGVPYTVVPNFGNEAITDANDIAHLLGLGTLREVLHG